MQATEKKLKTLSQSIEGDLKKIKKQKGAITQQVCCVLFSLLIHKTEGVRELLSKHDELTSYFGTYKQRIFHKYVKACSETFLAQKEHYR